MFTRVAGGMRQVKNVIIYLRTFVLVSVIMILHSPLNGRLSSEYFYFPSGIVLKKDADMTGIEIISIVVGIITLVIASITLLLKLLTFLIGIFDSRYKRK